MVHAYFSHNTLPHSSVSLTKCISIVFFSYEYFDPYDHYAKYWVTLRIDTSGGSVNFGALFHKVWISYFPWL